MYLGFLAEFTDLPLGVRDSFWLSFIEFEVFIEVGRFLVELITRGLQNY